LENNEDDYFPFGSQLEALAFIALVQWYDKEYHRFDIAWIG
jgi:hypothetical protein